VAGQPVAQPVAAAPGASEAPSQDGAPATPAQGSVQPATPGQAVQPRLQTGTPAARPGQASGTPAQRVQSAQAGQAGQPSGQVVGSNPASSTPPGAPAAPAVQAGQTPAPTTQTATPAAGPAQAVQPVQPAAQPAGTEAPVKKETKSSGAATAPAAASAPAGEKAPAKPTVAEKGAGQTTAPGNAKGAGGEAKTPAAGDSAAQGETGAEGAEGGKAEAASKGEDGKGAGFSSSVALGMVTVDGENVSRLAFRPEFSLGSFGVALDLELFFNASGMPTARGWEFDNSDQTINSLLRKIYYVRWNQPGDGFYIRAGALEGITMDAAGLVTSGYGNVALYPGQKQLGVHVQFNDWFEPVNLSAEAFTNSIEDWKNGGGVLGMKGSLQPMGFMGLPLKIGAFMVADFNQYATVSNVDGDACPDLLDDYPEEAARCKSVADQLDRRAIDEATNGDQVLAAYDEAVALADSLESQIGEQFNESDVFGMVGVDYSWLLFEPLNLQVYGEAAYPPSSDGEYDDDWGLVPVGVGLEVFIFRAGLEMQMFNGRFSPGHFNSYYEAERSQFTGTEFVSKEKTTWFDAADQGMRKGVFGKLGADLGTFAYMDVSYAHLMPETGDADRSISGAAGLGESILTYIPKLTKLESFFEKTNVDAEGEGFFGLSTTTHYGYRVGFDLGGGMGAVVESTNGYTRDEEGELEAVSNFTVETVLSF
jgi:hypothetical protein